MWETKGATLESIQTEPFEFALVESTYLAKFAVKGDPSDFAEHLEKCPLTAIGCSFENLGGDAILIAPKPQHERGCTDCYSMYGHLGTFMRNAKDDKIASFWKLVAETYQQRLTLQSPNTLWLSTCGTGVAWLHVRLDSRPKYYEYGEFAQTTGRERMDPPPFSITTTSKEEEDISDCD